MRQDREIQQVVSPKSAVASLNATPTTCQLFKWIATGVFLGLITIASGS